MNNNIVNIRKVDRMGRITIPYECRHELLDIKSGDKVLMIWNMSDKSITIKKYEPNV